MDDEAVLQRNDEAVLQRNDEAVLQRKVSTSFATCMRLAVKLLPRLRETFPTLNELIFPLYTREQITGWPLSAQLDEWDVRHAFLQALEETSEESRGCWGHDGGHALADIERLDVSVIYP